MPLIAISSDTPEVGQEIAEQTAQRLGFKLLGRELLSEVAQEHGLAPAELIKALDDPPGFMGMRARRRRMLLTYIRAACLERMQADNLVCHGLGAHLYLTGVSHAMRVRILQDPAARAKELTQGGLSPEKAEKALRRLDDQRRRWSLEAFGADETKPGNYDMVLSLASLEQQQAVEIICEANSYPKFQAMTYSRKCLADKALSAQVRLALQQQFPGVRLVVTDGTVVAQVPTLKREQRKKQKAVRELASQVPGVTHVEVHLINDIFTQAAISDR